MKHLLICISLSMALCSCQTDFPNNYDTLDSNNLTDFIKDWKTWSDDVAKSADNVEICKIISVHFNELKARNDSALAAAYSTEDPDDAPEFAQMKRLHKDSLLASLKHKHIVLPHSVPVWHYDRDYVEKKESAPIRAINNNFTLSKQDEMTLAFDNMDAVLYEDSVIHEKLKEYIGCKSTEEWVKANEKAQSKLALLNTYIPIKQSNIIGEWYFTTFPIINNIKIFTDGMLVRYQTSTITGKEIWHTKEDGHYNIKGEVRTEWIR